MNPRSFLPALLPCLLVTAPLHAVIFDATGDPAFNTTAPTGALTGSGWQFEGTWGGFLGTPIAPNYFITAAHIGGSIGQTIQFQGVDYPTDASFSDPESDLLIWRIAGTFPTYAPLYTAGNETGLGLVVIGRGTQRGAEVKTAGGTVLHGWDWGASDGVQRWGTNTVSGFANGDTLLAADFNHIGGTEAHLSVGDSGGAVFVRDPVDSVWKLAGINFAVNGPYSDSALGGGEFNAALFNENGYFLPGATAGTRVPATGPGTFFATRISARLDFIEATVAPEPGAVTLLLLGFGSVCCRRRRSGALKLPNLGSN